MSEGEKSLLTHMPPWGWILVYMAGGGALGVGGFELTHSGHKPAPAEAVPQECPDDGEELKQANREIRDLKAAHENMVANFTLLTDLLSKCNSQ